MPDSAGTVQCHGATMLPDILLDMPEGRNTLQGSRCGASGWPYRMGA